MSIFALKIRVIISPLFGFVLGSKIGEDQSTLFKIAKIYEDKKDYTNALRYFQILLDQHKDGIFIDEALFFSAEMYRKFLFDNEKAKNLYRGRALNTKESPKKFLSKKKSKQILEYLSLGYSQYEIKQILNCSYSTISKVKRLSSDTIDNVS